MSLQVSWPQVNSGKTQIWNSAGIKPEDLDTIGAEVWTSTQNAWLLLLSCRKGKTEENLKNKKMAENL